MTTACTPLKTLFRNTLNNITMTVTNSETQALVNGVVLTWSLTTFNQSSTIASGTATDTGTLGKFTATVALSDAQNMVAGQMYLLIVTIAASNFVQTFKLEAVNN